MSLALSIAQTIGIQSKVLIGVVDNYNTPPFVDVNIRSVVIPGLSKLSTYTPVAGDIVFIVAYGSSYLILGAIG